MWSVELLDERVERELSSLPRDLRARFEGKRIVVVRAFVKKSQKTPKNELEIARQRAQEVI